MFFDRQRLAFDRFQGGFAAAHFHEVPEFGAGISPRHDVIGQNLRQLALVLRFEQIGAQRP